MSKAAEQRRQQARRDKLFEDTLREQFKKVQSQSIAMGAIAMCKNILDMATDETKSEAERLKEIVDFCMVTVRPKKQQPEEKTEEKKDEV